MQKLKDLGESIVSLEEQAMTKTCNFILSNVPPYPPPSPKSRYIRTGLLGRSITKRVETQKEIVRGKVGTNVIYAPWVISSVKLPDGRGGQAFMHRGRWWTLQEVVANSKPENFFINELKSLLIQKMESR